MGSSVRSYGAAGKDPLCSEGLPEHFRVEYSRAFFFVSRKSVFLSEKHFYQKGVSFLSEERDFFKDRIVYHRESCINSNSRIFCQGFEVLHQK